MQVLLGTYTKKESKGIYSLTVDKKTNECKELINYLKIDNPTYITVDGERVFSVCQQDEKAGIAYFSNGLLVNQVLNQKVAPCYVSFDSGSNVLFSANYHLGQINSYQLVNGYMESLQKIKYKEGSKAHYIQMIRDFNSVFVCDLGLDEVHVYRMNDEKLLEHRQTLSFDANSGPRHMVSHPSQQILFVLSELSYEVFIVKYQQEFVIVDKIAANPTGETKAQHGAAIRISNDGKFLYTSNRSDNSLSVFKILEDGSLILIQHISTFGLHPRDFNISPDQNYLLVANLNTQNLTLFKRDSYSGKLTLLQKGIVAYEPVCVVFR